MEYEREIRKTYKDCAELFVTHSSDLLHLSVAWRQRAGANYQCLVTTSPFQKYDILAEIRGSVISYSKLRRVVEEGKVEVRRLPTLLYLNHQHQFLLSPKNITKYLFTAPRSAITPAASNCYI